MPVGMECPDANDLQELMAAQLAAARRAGVTRHLDGCAECREVLASLARQATNAGLEQTATAPAEQLGIAVTVDSGGSVAMTRSEHLTAGAKIGRYVIAARLGAALGWGLLL